MLKKILADANVNVVLKGINIIGLMAKGMRKSFSPFAKMLFPLLLHKFREKKTLIIEETKSTLDNFFYVFNIEDVIDDLKEGLTDKTSVMKLQIINWLDRYFSLKIEKTGEIPQKSKEAFKHSLISIFKSLFDDGVAEVNFVLKK